jgi:hypothetical protein
MNVGILICTEPAFEAKSRLLVRSLRDLGGIFSDVAIHSYSPRAGLAPTRDCMGEFRRFNVYVNTLNLNVEFSDYGIANKIFACSHAESHLPYDVLVLLDSDVVVLDEPLRFELDEDCDFAARPASQKNIGFLDERDPEYDYWNKLHAIVGTRPNRKVVTSMSNDEIHEYYNSGLVIVKRSAGIFSAWLDLFQKSMRQGIRPASGIYHADQATLAAVVTARAKCVRILPQNYNVPCSVACRLVTSSNYPDWLPVTALHYRHLFDQGGWRSLLSRSDTWFRSDQVSWLKENLERLQF